MSDQPGQIGPRAPGRLLSRVPVAARMGSLAAVVLFAGFTILLLATASDRLALRREVVGSLLVRMRDAGVDLATPGDPAHCRPELAYDLQCTVAVAGGFSARLAVTYVASGCWTAQLVSASAPGLGIPSRLQSCRV